jgi:LCP family protein required for cell wall assembly
MKLSGNKKNGRHSTGHYKSQAFSTEQTEQSARTTATGAIKKKKKLYRAARVLIIILVIILALLVALYIYIKVGLKPPEVNEVPKPTSSGSADAGASADLTEQPDRIPKKYTLAILGMDDGFGNTDTMMVATFDDMNYTLNVVSIPRDTLVNVSWPTKKANSFYAYGQIDGVVEGMTDILGYRVDKYVKIDLDAFSKLVDAIGGVTFDVPKDMNYDDDSQDLHIHLIAGPQLLDGNKALQLVRARKNVWDNGDIGRIETQQAFLKAAVGLILEKKNSIDIFTLIDIILNDVDTNLTVGDLGWYARELLKMDAANVSFEMIPANYYDKVSGDSYCTIKVDDWLSIINAKLNPFDFEIKAEDLSILTRDANGELYVTNGVWAGKQSWGSNSSLPSGGGSGTSPKPSVEPSAQPSPSPSSSPDDNPSDISPSPGGEDSSPDISPTETGGDASPSPSETPTPDVTPDQTPTPEDSDAPSPDETETDDDD